MNQIINNLISQAGQMQLAGIPNDTIQALEPLCCVILGPLAQKILYPTLRSAGIRFGPISRMTWAFLVMGGAMAMAAGVQQVIYTRAPCYQYPLHCMDAPEGTIPNEISVWLQTPIYFLLAFAAILGLATMAEYTYSEAPTNMRCLVQAISQLGTGVGSGLGMALSPVSVSPKILWLYTALSFTMIIIAPIFWLLFRSYDKKESASTSFKQGHS